MQIAVQAVDGIAGCSPVRMSVHGRRAMPSALEELTTYIVFGKALLFEAAC